MLADGRIVLLQNPVLALAPGAMIIITVTSLNVFSDCVRSYLDPTQRKLPPIRKLMKKFARKTAGVTATAAAADGKAL
jgi:hypothetical protein